MKDIINRLDRIDWDFPQAGTAPGSIHKFHWFPGNFIPQIPAALIEILSSPGDVVLDPFGGSGTTSIEAALLGRRSLYSDRISASVFLAKAKSAALSHGLTSETRDRVLEAITFDHTCLSEAVGINGEGGDTLLSLWYAPRTLAQLRYLWAIIERETAEQRLILLLVFSDLLFACASTGGSLTATGKKRRHHWGWVADNVIPKQLIEHNAIAEFRSRLIVLGHLKAMAFDEPTFLQNDARALPICAESVDLVVTSPPYIGVIDYVRANRMMYMWMGWPFDMERAEEIGARYKRKRLMAARQYLDEMKACWNEIYRVLRPNGHLAIVIGESRAFPGIFKSTLKDISELMPIVWGPRERMPTRRRVADRADRDPHEVVLVAAKL